jgi:hypothetical protein
MSESTFKQHMRMIHINEARGETEQLQDLHYNDWSLHNVQLYSNINTLKE